MQTVTFIVESLKGEREASDLACAITTLSGVADVQIDPATRAVTVQYAPEFISPEMIRGTITGVGYTVDGAG